MEVGYVFRAMLCFWRHAMVFEACNVFGGMVRIRMHAMFLEACLASGRHLLLYVRAIFWKHLHAGMQLALQRGIKRNSSMSCLCHKVTMSYWAVSANT